MAEKRRSKMDVFRAEIEAAFQLATPSLKAAWETHAAALEGAFADLLRYSPEPLDIEAVQLSEASADDLIALLATRRKLAKKRAAFRRACARWRRATLAVGHILLPLILTAAAKAVRS